MCAEGAHEVADVVAHRLAAQVQRRGDLPRRLAARQQLEHILLAWREGRFDSGRQP
jgi:hypothetical protein